MFSTRKASRANNQFQFESDGANSRNCKPFVYKNHIEVLELLQMDIKPESIAALITTLEAETSRSKLASINGIQN
jgi:hypothetical protein